jgi:hypothetical protein
MMKKELVVSMMGHPQKAAMAEANLENEAMVKLGAALVKWPKYFSSNNHETFQSRRDCHADHLSSRYEKEFVEEFLSS